MDFHFIVAGKNPTHFMSSAQDELKEYPSSMPKKNDGMKNHWDLGPEILNENINVAASDETGERREVTILFLDISDFTGVSQSLDSESVYLFINEAMRLLAEVIYKFEGNIDKFMGDGLMALFGAPVAHENDPERAVRAALEMLAILPAMKKRLKEKYGVNFEIRMGINSGLVIAGKIGPESHLEYTVIGDTVNLAKRLEENAQPGTILASSNTYQLTKPLFEYKALAPIALKGIKQPVTAYQALTIKEKSDRLRSMPGGNAPMIGREEDLDKLQKALDEVINQGSSRIVMLSGEAGVGKSRLVGEFRSSSRDLHIDIYQGNCPAYTRSKPLWVVSDLLRDILNFSHIDPTPIQIDTLHSFLKKHGLDNDNVLPYLALMLGLQIEDEKFDIFFRKLDAKMLQKQTHSALRKLLLALAQLNPVVLIFEDLHWIDPASRDFLEYLVQTAAEAPLMLVFSSRQLEREMVLNALLKTVEKIPDQFVDIQLRALSDTEGQCFLDQIINETSGQTEPLKKRIADRAAGNPLYIEEIVRMLIDQGKLEKDNDTWRVREGAYEALQKVPESLQGLVLARYDKLPATLRHTLYHAAVLGSPFPTDLLIEMKRATTKSITKQLHELVAKQFIIPKPFKSSTGFAFRHSLIQEGIYSTLLKRPRQKIHLQAALAIGKSSIWTQSEKAQVLAFHYYESSKPKRAIPYLIKAAAKATSSGANEIAIEQYRKACALLSRPTIEQSESFSKIWLGLGKALKLTGEYLEARRILTEALDQLEEWDTDSAASPMKITLVETLRELADVFQREGAFDPALKHLETSLRKLGKTASPNKPELMNSVLDRIAWIYFRQGKLQRAHDAALQAIENAATESDINPTIRASLRNTLGGVCWQQGNLDKAIAHVQLSLQWYDKLNYSWGMGVAYNNLGVLHDIRGDWTSAISCYERAYSLQKSIGDLENQACSLDNLGILRMAMGDYAASQQNLKTALKIREQLGESFGMARSRSSLAHLRLLENRLKSAARHAEVSLNLAKAIGGKEIEVRANWILAIVQANNGELKLAIATAEKAHQMASEGGFVDEEIDCQRIAGLLLARGGRFNEAMPLLQGSLELSRQQRDPYRQGLALLELSQALLNKAEKEKGKETPPRIKAEEYCREAIRIFNALGSVPNLNKAEETLQLCLHRP